MCLLSKLCSVGYMMFIISRSFSSKLRKATLSCKHFWNHAAFISHFSDVISLDFESLYFMFISFHFISLVHDFHSCHACHLTFNGPLKNACRIVRLSLSTSFTENGNRKRTSNIQKHALSMLVELNMLCSIALKSVFSCPRTSHAIPDCTHEICSRDLLFQKHSLRVLRGLRRVVK